MSPNDKLTDSHVHVLDPVRFPYATDSWYHPVASETAPVSQLEHVLEAHGVQHALIVGPNSGYNFDNRCLLDAIAQGAGRYKGVVVVRNNASQDELQELQAKGAVGVAFQVQLMGLDLYSDIGPLLQRMRDLGLWAQVQVHQNQLVQLRSMLLDSGVGMIFDHCGRPDANAGLGQPGFQALLALAETGRAHVKLSSLNKCSAQPYPYADAWPYVHALVEAFTPYRLMWASDWPFLRSPHRIDYGPILNLFKQLLPDPQTRQAVFWDTPQRLFRFGA